MESSVQIDYRCSCGKLLFRGLVFRSFLEAKCPRCNKLNFIDGMSITHNPNRVSFLTTKKGKIVNISSSVESALGFSAGELIEENIRRIFSDDSIAKTDEFFINKINGIRYLRLDASCRKRNGEIVPVSIIYRHLLVNGGELFLRIVDIIPEIDKKLLDEAKFDSANFCDVVTETDENGTILYLDKNLKDITGLNPEDLVGMKVDDLVFDEEKDWHLKNYRMLRAKKRAYRIVPGYKVSGKNGEFFEQEVYCTPFYDDAGNFIGFRNMHWLRKLPVDK
ncbi:MAG: PAS domain S-box protein [Candidatus Moranbacteria bacterium]|nr:PAS domain S-box protein [Candidatus Moranbacteria bacterium]